jgi:hypothetical protein
MKLKISIDQQAKSGFLSGTTHTYKLNVQFQLNEKEKKVFNDHPLIQKMNLMTYAIGKDKKYSDNISAKDAYEGKIKSIEAFSVNEIIEYRNTIVSSAENFVGYFNILSDILGGAELTFGE